MLSLLEWWCWLECRLIFVLILLPLFLLNLSDDLNQLFCKASVRSLVIAILKLLARVLEDCCDHLELRVWKLWLFLRWLLLLLFFLRFLFLFYFNRSNYYRLGGNKLFYLINQLFLLYFSHFNILLLYLILLLRFYRFNRWNFSCWLNFLRSIFNLTFRTLCNYNGCYNWFLLLLYWGQLLFRLNNLFYFRRLLLFLNWLLLVEWRPDYYQRLRLHFANLLFLSLFIFLFLFKFTFLWFCQLWNRLRRRFKLCLNFATVR